MIGLQSSSRREFHQLVKEKSKLKKLALDTIDMRFP